VAQIINLNKFRKAKARAEKLATAAQNRRKHGRSAADKARETAKLEKLERELEGKRLVPDE
jgi:chorismate mutase